MKKIKTILILFHVLSIIVCISAIKTLWERKDWIVTTATITFIGRPDGVVYCEYVDNEGVLHSHPESEPTVAGPYYYDFRYIGNGGGNVSSLIGTTVKIAYKSPALNEVAKDHHLRCYCHIFSYILSVMLLCVYRKAVLKKIEKDNLTANHNAKALYDIAETALRETSQIKNNFIISSDKNISDASSEKEIYNKINELPAHSNISLESNVYYIEIRNKKPYTVICSNWEYSRHTGRFPNYNLTCNFYYRIVHNAYNDFIAYNTDKS